MKTLQLTVCCWLAGEAGYEEKKLAPVLLDSTCLFFEGLAADGSCWLQLTKVKPCSQQVSWSKHSHGQRSAVSVSSKTAPRVTLVHAYNGMLSIVSRKARQAAVLLWAECSAEQALVSEKYFCPQLYTPGRPLPAVSDTPLTRLQHPFWQFLHPFCVPFSQDFFRPLMPHALLSPPPPPPPTTLTPFPTSQHSNLSFHGPLCLHPPQALTNQAF